MCAGSPVIRWNVSRSRRPRRPPGASGCAGWADVDRAGERRAPGPASRGERRPPAPCRARGPRGRPDSCPRPCAPPGPAVGVGLDLAHRLAGLHVEAHLAHGRADERAHVGVELGHRHRSARTTVTSRPAAAAAPRPSPARCSRRRGRRPASPPAAIAARMSAPSASRCTPYTPSASRPGTGGRVGPAAGGDDEGVVAEPPAAGAARPSRRSRSISSARQPVRTVDVVRLEVAGRPRDQPVAVGHQVADPVGDPAGGEGGVGALLEDDDLQLVGVRRRRACAAADIPAASPPMTTSRLLPCSPAQGDIRRGASRRHARGPRNTLPGLSRPGGVEGGLDRPGGRPATRGRSRAPASPP